MPAVSVSSTSLSALSAVATLQATSSIVRLNASPVGEKPSGESSTSPPLASTKRSASVSTLRTTPVSCRSTPSMMPIGRAVTKLPLMTRTLRVRHRGRRQALREGGLDIEADFAGGFLRALERGGVGDAQVVVELRLERLAVPAAPAPAAANRAPARCGCPLRSAARHPGSGRSTAHWRSGCRKRR